MAFLLLSDSKNAMGSVNLSSRNSTYLAGWVEAYFFDGAPPKHIRPHPA